MENTNKKKVSIDNILKAKKERNAKAKPIILSNARRQNEQIAIEHGFNVEDNVLGEVGLDLESQCLDQEYEGLKRADLKIKAMQQQVLNRLKAQSEEDYIALNSVEEEIIECDFEEIGELPALPPRQSKFNSSFFLESSPEEIKLIEESKNNISSKTEYAAPLPEGWV